MSPGRKIRLILDKETVMTITRPNKLAVIAVIAALASIVGARRDLAGERPPCRRGDTHVPP